MQEDSPIIIRGGSMVIEVSENLSIEDFKGIEDDYKYQHPLSYNLGPVEIYGSAAGILPPIEIGNPQDCEITVFYRHELTREQSLILRGNGNELELAPINREEFSENGNQATHPDATAKITHVHIRDGETEQDIPIQESGKCSITVHFLG
jgi:hypothetical protein